MAKKPRSRAADYATYLAVRAAVAVIQMLTARVAYRCADAFAWLLYTLIPARRRVALENVRAAFPELDAARADRIVRGMFRHFTRALVELAMMPRKLRPHTWRKYFAASETGMTQVYANRPAILVGGHFGNWEMAGFVMGLLGLRTHAIARALDNPYLERFALRFRQGTGQTIIAKNDDFDRLTALMGAGGRVGILADQDAGPRGPFVAFFGRPASTHKAVALLAIQYDAVIVVGGVPRVRRGDYPQRPDFDPARDMAPMFYAMKVVDVIDPRDFAADPNAVVAITQRFTTGLEHLIRAHPEQYFWVHKRWKHQPKAKPATRAA